MTPNAEIQKIAERVLQSQFASSRIVGCRVASEEDFDGAEIVRVTAVSEIPVDDASARLAANLAIRDELLQRGDDRYVFLDIELSSDQPDEDDGDPEPERRQAS
jgi:hypothetical protein